MGQPDLGLELRIVFIVHQIDVLLSDKRIFIGSESLYYIRGFMYFVGRTGICLSRRQQGFDSDVVVQSISSFTLYLEIQHIYVHLVIGIFVEDVEWRPVIAVVLKTPVFIIGAQSATCSESIREWIDVEIALKYSKRIVLALRHRARCLLRTDVTLCREHSRELIVYIKGILHIGRKSAHLVGNGPSRIVIETYRRIGSRVLATARKRYHMISDGLHRKEKIKPVGVGIFVFAQEIHPCLGRIG